MTRAAFGLTGFSRAALLLILATALALLALRPPAPEQGWLTTDLRDLTPALARDPQVNAVLDALASAVENRFILVIRGPDADTVSTAGEVAMRRLAAEEDLFQVLDADAALARILPLLREYRFNLLTARQREQLASAADADILARARQSLFSVGGRLAPLAVDPLNWFSDYLLAYLDAAATGTGSSEAQCGPRSCFISVWVDVRGQAMRIDDQERISVAIAGLESELASLSPDLELLRSGVFFFAADATAKTRGEITLISTIATVGVLLLLVLSFSSLLPLVLPLLSIGAGVGAALVFSIAIFDSVHILTILFGASLIGVVVDYSLHYFYHHMRPEAGAAAGGDQPGRAGGLYRALAFSLLTSVIGYGALAFSELLSLQRVAVFSVIGLVTAWLTVLAAAPWFLRGGMRPRTRLVACITGWLERWVGFVAQRVGRFWPLALLLLGGLILLLRIPVSDDPRAFFTPSSFLAQQEREVASLVNDYEPGIFVLVRGDSVPAVYRRIGALEQALQPLQDAGGLDSISRWLPAPAAQARDYAAAARLYREGGLAGDFLREIGAEAGLAEAVSRDYAAAAGEILTPERMIARLDGLLPPLWAAREGIQYAVVRIPKGQDLAPLADYAAGRPEVLLVNSAAMAAQAIGTQRRSATVYLALAYLLISVLLGLRYRSAHAALPVLVPLCASLGTLLVFIGFGVQLTLFHTMAFFLVLGLGMDYVIFAREMTRTATEYQATVQAVVLSALTSMLSFGLLGFSSMPVVAGFGLTLLLGNGFNLLFTLAYAGHRKRGSL